MPEEFTREELMQRWRGFLALHAEPQIGDVLSRYPEARSLYFQYFDIERQDEALAAQLCERPQASLYAAELAVAALVAEDARRPRGEVKLHVRVRGLPQGRPTRAEVRDLRTKHLGKLLAIPGMVRRRSDVRPRVVEAAYRCERCYNVVIVEQEGFDLTEPAQCYKDQGGCDRAAASTRFKLLEERSRVVDVQRLVLQELPELVKEGEQPERVTCWVVDDLAGAAKPGQRVTINGILRAMAAERRRASRGILETYMEVISVESDEKTGDLELTQADVAAIEAAGRAGDMVKRLARSIAPTLYGLEVEKTAIALQLFGGSRKPMPDGVFLRGEIHVLLLGDPSTGKSQLLQAVKALHYRAVGTTGRGASGAGLTAAVIKDEVTGEYGLEPGVMPMANGGIACIDEIDKMNEEDRDRMHPAMEQGIVEISKAGIQATMAAAASVLAAANPKHGAWAVDRALSDQVNLPMSLISRFDAVFVLKDVPDGGEHDRRLADHILQAHYVGSLQDQETPPAPGDVVAAAFQPPLTGEFIRKYIYYARTRRTAPVMTPETIAKLRQHFLDLRKETAGQEEHAARIWPRNLDGMVRFAEASARARLSPRVELQDAELAIRIFESWVSRFTENGRVYDLNVLYGGFPESVKAGMDSLKEIIREVGHGGAADTAAVMERAVRDLDMGPDRVRYLIEKLYSEGHIYEAAEGKWRVA